MKTLSSTLLTEQKKTSALPAVSLVARQYGHPQKAGGSGGAAADGLQWGILGWTKLYGTDSIAPNYHGVAIPADGSLNRVRTTPMSGGIVHQRVANPVPSSDFGTTWNQIMYAADYPCCIAALGAEVIAFTSKPGQNLVQYARSTNSGASFDAATYIPNSWSALRAVAAAFKSNGDLIVVGADPGSYKLWVEKRVSEIWSFSAMPSPPNVEGLAVYHDGDWNIIALVNTGSTLQVARIVFGDGYRVATGTWSSLEYINTGRATIDEFELIQQYYQKRELSIPPMPPPQKNKRIGSFNVYQTYWNEFYAMFQHPRSTEENWSKVSALLAARATDNIGLDAPFIAKPSSGPPILSIYKQGDKWFFRLRPATDFYDSDWNRAFKQQGSCAYGFAIACDSNFIWGTRASEVWRSRLPGTAWPTPTAGSGASANSETIAEADILSVVENIQPMSRSELEIILDNSTGAYSSLPTTHIKRGSRIELGYGYRTASAETSEGNHYFLEYWTCDRAPNVATVTLHCIDGWGLLEKYVIPGPHEFNLVSNTHTVYDIIDKLIQCIGGTISYKSRSSVITSLYPKLEVHAGETGAGLLRRMLELVPDVIYFSGLNAYIVYPQTNDSPSYSYFFPGGY